MRNLELKIPPLLVVLVFALLMYAVAWALPVANITINAKINVALVFAILGILIVVAAITAFRRHRTTVNPLAPDESTAVVADGIYRVSRNPMYLGFLLILAAWAVYLANAAAVLLVPCFAIWMTELQIKPEERALAARFGDEYTQYLARVRRWL